MDLAFKPEHAAFRAEVRDWIEANFPKAIRDKQATGEHLNRRRSCPGTGSSTPRAG